MFLLVKYYDIYKTKFNQERQSLWIPSVTFLNTASQTEISNDKKAYAWVTRLGNFSYSDMSNHENVYEYGGAENPLTLGRLYQTKWICAYNMQYYPFDTQVNILN